MAAAKVAGGTSVAAKVTVTTSTAEGVAMSKSTGRSRCGSEQEIGAPSRRSIFLLSLFVPLLYIQLLKDPTSPKC
jgi:hypothetical protein